MAPWFVLAAFTALLIRNLLRIRSVTRDTARGKVSILIPARNEEFMLPGCLLSAVFTSAAEILVYDDASDDNTAHVVYSSMARYDRIRLIEGGPLPEGWVGKAHACHKLAEAATSDWLLFLDAGTRISSQAVERLLSEAERGKLTWLTFRAEVESPTFAQRLILPALDFVTLGLSPAILAHGSGTLVHKATYELLGGHQEFAGEVGSDLNLVREWRKRGERAGYFDGLGLLQSGRRDDYGALWTTFRRHLYLAFPGPAVFFGFLALASFFLLLPWWPWFVVLLLLRTCYALRLKQPVWSALLHPVAVLFLAAAALASFGAARSKQGVNWKGRQYLVD